MSLFIFLFVSVRLIHGFSPQIIKMRLGIEHWNSYLERLHRSMAQPHLMYFHSFPHSRSVLVARCNCGRSSFLPLLKHSLIFHIFYKTSRIPGNFGLLLEETQSEDEIWLGPLSWTKRLCKEKIHLPHSTSQNRVRSQVWKCGWGTRSHLCSPRANGPPCASQRPSADRSLTGLRWSPGGSVDGSIPWRSEKHRQIQIAASPPHSPTEPSAKGAGNLNVNVEIQ